MTYGVFVKLVDDFDIIYSTSHGSHPCHINLLTCSLINLAEEDGVKAVPGNDELAERDNEHNIDKIKRAAISAISAAAVKARILASEEEDQIRQLAALVIEKQVIYETLFISVLALVVCISWNVL